MPLISDEPFESKSRRGRSWAFGCLGALGVVGAAVWGYVLWANILPPHPAAPAVQLPQPNRYDAVNAAVARVRVAPGNGPVSNPRSVSAAELQEAVAEQQPAFNQLRRALRLPFMTPVPSTDGSSFGHMAGYRQAARALAAEACVARTSGQYARAVSSGLDGIELSVETQRGGVYSHALVGVAVCSIVMRELEAAIPHVSAQEAHRLGGRLDEVLTVAPTFGELARSERYVTRAESIHRERQTPTAAHSLLRR